PPSVAKYYPTTKPLLSVRLLSQKQIRDDAISKQATSVCDAQPAVIDKQSALNKAFHRWLCCRGEQAAIDTFAQTQTQHDFLHVVFFRRQRFRICDMQLALAQHLDIARRQFLVVETLLTDVRVRARTCTPPFFIAPIDHIVAALPAFLGPVGDLVPAKACIV